MPKLVCPVALILGSLMLPLAGCNADDAPEPERGNAKPEASQLSSPLPSLPVDTDTSQGIRAVAASDNWQLGNSAWDYSDPGTQVNGTTLEIDSGAIPVAWGLYQWGGLISLIPLRVETDLNTAGGAEYWIVLSNYATHTWDFRGPLDGSQTGIEITGGSNFVSPAGNTFVGLVVEGGNQLAINRLNLIVEEQGTLLFEEPFEDTDFEGRGWYDNPNFLLTTAEHAPGSTQAAELHFAQGAMKPDLGFGRVLFEPTGSVYVSFYIKYSENWTGSNLPYHPHEFLILTNMDSKWEGPAYTHLTSYIEHNEGVPLLSIQDAKNIDEARIGEDLTDISEARAVAGCNGSTDGYNDDCYLSGETHRNGKQWKAEGVYFADEPGPYYKNDWHLIEAYFQLNSIEAGIGITDGVLKYWYDGELLINHEDVLFRTGEQPDILYNQFMVAPWIGDGSPVSQTMWLDNLVIATGRL